MMKSRRIARKHKPLAPDAVSREEKIAPALEAVAPNPALLRLSPQAAAGLPAVQRTAWARDMHHVYGNQRLQRMLTNGPAAPAFSLDSRPVIRRYESGEHAQFGAKPGETEKIIKIKGVEITYGEMIAMGDMFEDPEAINNATVDQLTKVRDLIREEKKFYTKKGGKKVSEDEWDQATGGAYLKLAAKNTAHFKDANIKQWETYHRKAMVEAQKKDGMNSALTINAFADHFLTDAFSAGHLIDKPAAMKRAKDNLTDTDTFATQIANRVMANTAAAALLAPYEGKRNLAGWTYYPMDATTLMNIVQIIRRWEGDSFFSNFAKLVHDRLNRDVDPATPGSQGGIEVHNDRGDQWRMSGDDKLSFSPKTLEIVQLAVGQSRQNLDNAAADKKYDLDKAVNYVMVYVPKPTAAGQKQIDDAQTALLDPTQIATMDAFAQVITGNMDALVHKLEEKGLIRRRAVAGGAAPAAGTPVPAVPPPAH